jgi:hypothetical protein
VNVANHSAVPDKDLVIDPLATRNDFEIHLKDGTILRDWAKGRINNVPASDSVPSATPRI